MLRFLFKKITGRNKPKEPSKIDKAAEGFRSQSTKLANLFSQKISEASEEFKTMKSKMNDLEASNFNLGRLHLEKGDLKEATFRFFLMTKFYPHNYDAKYELAYCYALREKYSKSQRILEKLLTAKPDYDKRAADLLTHVRKLQSN
ncbi:MAG: tetratricopeptide repeat protein [Rickettsiales bacterium]|nr:tetratricopeptide repeat protein [Rickettsiales bacterium]